MFYTLTTNPAIDINMSTKSVKPDIVNRTSNATYSANGKGLNVSFVLKKLATRGVKVYENVGDSPTPYVLQTLNLDTKKLTQTLYVEASK